MNDPLGNFLRKLGNILKFLKNTFKEFIKQLVEQRYSCKEEDFREIQGITTLKEFLQYFVKKTSGKFITASLS